MRYWRYPEYVTVDEKKARAARKLKELSKKNSRIKPVIIEGSAIARTWWGKAWNRNLGQYADYSNRIGRGRNYVRHGAVLDLQIESGEINALVQGSRQKPYSVSIKIQTLKKDIWHKIKTSCEDTLESFQEMLSGAFPKALGEIFTSRDTGMFPAPCEIKFSCSCPDWASMCKHVAAALYGVGARLDEDPKLFFKLRDADISELIKQTVTDKTKKLLEKAAKKSSRIIEDTDLSTVFGIDFDEPDSSVRLNPVEPFPARKKHKSAPPAKRKPSLKKGTKKRETNKEKKKIAERHPSKKAHAKRVVVKKTAVKAGRKSTRKNARKKKEP